MQAEIWIIPQLRGNLHFDNAVLVPVITGEPLKLSKDVISFDEDGFNFDNFAMLDSAGNKATLDGNVFTKDFKNYRFDMSFSAQNFRMVNAPKEPNRIFYGKLNLNADIDVTGDLESAKGELHYLRVNKNTDFYVILPSDDPEVVDRDGVVVFTNKTRKVGFRTASKVFWIRWQPCQSEGYGCCQLPLKPTAAHSLP